MVIGNAPLTRAFASGRRSRAHNPGHLSDTRTSRVAVTPTSSQLCPSRSRCGTLATTIMARLEQGVIMFTTVTIDGRFSVPRHGGDDGSSHGRRTSGGVGCKGGPGQDAAWSC